MNTSHAGHNHPATTAARTACRKATNAAETKVQMAAANFLYVAHRRGDWQYNWAVGIMAATAVRLAVVTPDEAFGVIEWINGERVQHGSTLSTIDLLVAIYRKNPDFSWDIFCRMHS